MKRLTVKAPENCVQCRLCEETCAQIFHKDAKETLSHIRIVTDRSGKDTIRVCTQCGRCEKVCPVYAITKNSDGVYTIDKEICVGCMACVDICPENVICKSMDDICATKCTVCGACAENCPSDVLSIEEYDEKEERA